MNNSQFNYTLDLTIAGLVTSISDYMSAGAYRDFLLWALSADNPKRDRFLQVMGITQLIGLTLKLLGSVAEDCYWQDLARYSVAMNVYQIFEIVSDNLAIGLARPSSGDTTHELRRELLYFFNRAMVHRLSGCPRSASELLAPVQPLADRVSSFMQSLNPDKHRAIAREYVEQGGDVYLDDLEYTVWPLLVGNIETCVDLARLVNDLQGGALVTEGLINRYRAVNVLLEDNDMLLSRRASVGADSILVVPTIAYYIVVLANRIRPLDNFESIVNDGTLSEALYNAALLVRLLNDLGCMVAGTSKERAEVLGRLKADYLIRRSLSMTLPEFLLGEVDKFGASLTRLHKDLQHGEFNVCLSGLMDHSVIMPDALDIFACRLDYFSQLYTQSYARLGTLLESITTQLSDQTVSYLIGRFVQFHEALYSRPYSQAVGEYAI